MSKHALNKTIEARKLNKKTGVPVPGPEVAIPYGAHVEHPHRDGAMWRFTYNQELYRCADDVLTSALDRGALKGIVEAKDEEPKNEAPAVGGRVARPALRWEAVSSSQYSVMRSKVPGGWLVAAGSGPSLTFYPDPEHLWDGTSLE